MEKPKRIYFSYDHEFFVEGNALIGFKNDADKISCQISSENESMSSAAITCDFGGCTSRFDDESSFTEHYESRHRHVCTECRRSFISRFLVELHTMECHDPFFAVKSDKEPSFRCLLPTCPEKFQSTQLRKDHMMKIHKFPHDFRFFPSAIKKSNDTNTMDVEDEKASSASTKSKSLNSKVCFGSGSKKGFERRRLGKAWHQQGVASGGHRSGKSKDSASDQHTMDMSEISESLP